MVKKPTVYILRCANGMFYTGVTSEFDGRMAKHPTGSPASFTVRHGPCECVWHAEFATMAEAIQAEKQIQGWRRDKKIALIEGRFEDLPRLAMSYSKRDDKRPPDSEVVLRQAQHDGHAQSGGEGTPPRGRTSSP